MTLAEAEASYAKLKRSKKFEISATACVSIALVLFGLIGPYFYDLGELESIETYRVVTLLGASLLGSALGQMRSKSKEMVLSESLIKLMRENEELNKKVHATSE